MSRALERAERDMERTESGTPPEGSEYKAHILDLSRPVPEPEFLFSVGGVGTIPAGELVGVKGRAKNGKSQFAYLLVASALSGTAGTGSVRPLRPISKILLFDTEQSMQSLAKCSRRALKTAGRPIAGCDAFVPFYLRPLAQEERKAVISDAISGERPQLVIIDGIRDLLHDFNDLTESDGLVQWLMKTVADYGCTVVGVLHQNKDAKDGNMRGHLGTEFLNKISDCFEVSRKDGRFLVTCTDSRNLPAPDTAFSIDTEDKFMEAPTEAELGKQQAIAEMRETFPECFDGKAVLKHGELSSLYQRIAGVGRTTANNRISEALDLNLIAKGKGGYSLGTECRMPEGRRQGSGQKDTPL